MMTRTLIIAAAVLSHVAAATATARAGETCMADWSLAASVVRKEGLATVEQLSKLAHKRGRATSCG